MNKKNIEIEVEIKDERIERLIDNLKHELRGHILVGDEETWIDDYYTDGKLDYRKMLIGFLEDVINQLEEINNEQ